MESDPQKELVESDLQFYAKNIGQQPAVVEGWLNGYPFYFQAKWHDWTLHLAPTKRKALFSDEYSLESCDITKWRKVASGRVEKAGWMSQRYAHDLIINSFLPIDAERFSPKAP